LFVRAGEYGQRATGGGLPGGGRMAREARLTLYLYFSSVSVPFLFFLTFDFPALEL
jgi:hypothetical protein